MAAIVMIRDAELSDLPEMIALCCDAVAPDTINRFLYGHQPEEAKRKHTESLTASLGARFTRPTIPCHMHKAVSPVTGELLGWILVKWERGEPYVLSPNNPDERHFPTYYSRQIRQAWNRLLNGEAHVAIGALYVKVGHQRAGVGRKLVEHIYSQYKLQKELVIAQTGPRGEDFYLNMGFVTAGSTDIDLSEWGGRDRGYGLHRSPQMIRYPQS